MIKLQLSKRQEQPNSHSNSLDPVTPSPGISAAVLHGNHFDNPVVDDVWETAQTCSSHFPVLCGIHFRCLTDAIEHVHPSR
jgi:hypothetical protein